MKEWATKAAELLQHSLYPPRSELNELDWKGALSPDKKRLTEHLSAFSNHPGGGFLAYGVSNTGTFKGVEEGEVDEIINRLANLGRDSLEPPIMIDSEIHEIDGFSILFILIPESADKPVHLRGKSIENSFIRSGGSTRVASKQEIGSLMLNSRTTTWEELYASPLLKKDVLLQKLNVGPIFSMLDRPPTTTNTETLAWMEGEKFIRREPSGAGYITNLGAIAAAYKLTDFPSVSRSAVRVIEYDGTSKAIAKREMEGNRGYAIGFQGLLGYVTGLLPQSEILRQALRATQKVYPEIALRELIANALIHQDFTVTGAGPLVEIYSDRIEISNPGMILPSKQIDRLIGTQPESRNEDLARAFRRYKICEERGSGLIKAGQQIELYGLPPIEFVAAANYFKVIVHAPRSFAKMSVRERLQACYQHAVLKYYGAEAMTNKSLRERLNMPESQRSMVSVLIQEALEKKLIKHADPENVSKKFTEYLPAWA